MTNRKAYSPFYYFGTEFICPTEEYFSTVDEARDYLRQHYKDYSIIAEGEDWMGVTCDLIDIDDNGDILGGEVLETVVTPLGRFWWDYTDHLGDDIVIFEKKTP